MKKILEKIHGFTGHIEKGAVFIDAIVAGFKAYTAKMNEHHEKERQANEVKAGGE